MKVNKNVIIGAVLLVGILAAIMFMQKREGFEPTSSLDNYSFANATMSLKSSPFANDVGPTGKPKGCGCNSASGPQQNANGYSASY